MSDGDVLSHTTAALIHGLVVLSIPHKVQIIYLSRSRSGERFTRRQRPFRPGGETSRWHSSPVTNPVRTVLDIAAPLPAASTSAVKDGSPGNKHTEGQTGEGPSSRSVKQVLNLHLGRPIHNYGLRFSSKYSC